MADEPLMTAQEVARLMNVHPATVTRMANEGEIPAIRVGGQWRFRRAAVDEYLQPVVPMTRAEEALESANRG